MTAPAVPRPAATVMLLRDGDGLEVLLVERSTNLQFVPGAHVFPGGAVSAGDEASGLDFDLDADEATAILGVDRHGLAFWMAAVRECFEETGVLLATGPDGSALDPTHPVFAEADRVRAEVESGVLGLAEHLGRHGVRPALRELAYVAHWITPEFSPRRYDTRFFAALMPTGQRGLADGEEAVGCEWWRPDQALAAWQAGTIDLITPTASSLRLLAGFTTAAEAIGAFQAGARRPHRIAEPEGGVRVPVPGDEEVVR